MNRKPYVGITGFTAKEQVEAVLSVFPQLEGGTIGDWERLPVWMMAGILVSSKTMRGAANRFPERYPEIGQVPSLLVYEPRVLNLIHFNSREDDLASELKFLYEKVGNPQALGGVQLNIPWPEPESVKEFWRWATETRWELGYYDGSAEPYIVLQIGSTAFDMTDNDPVTLASWVQDYSGFVDYVLLDPSGGEGRSFDARALHPYLVELGRLVDGIGFGVAGGLSAENLSPLEELLALYPGLSCDAEGQLRNPDSDTLNLENAVAYARSAVALYAK
jgi:hypothetical protein